VLIKLIVSTQKVVTSNQQMLRFKNQKQKVKCLNHHISQCSSQHSAVSVTNTNYPYLSLIVPW